MNALLYTRVSHDEQVKYGYSLEAQKQTLIDYCNNNNYHVKGIYTDEGISGGSITKRKALQRMLSEAEQGDIILFTKLDRFSRNLLDANIIVQDLEAKGISIKATQEDDIDTTTADGKFIFNLKLSLAQREREKTAERVRDVMRYKGERGELVSGTVPLGYKVIDKKCVIDEETAPIARFIFETYDRTNNMQATYRAMVDKFGKVRCASSLKNILTSRTYIGLNAYNTAFCEPLIDVGMFNRIQDKLARNVKKTPTGRIYLFSRLIVCPVCGRKLYAHGYSDNTKNTYYHCSSRYIGYGGKCGFGHIREDKLEAQLLDSIELFAEQTVYRFKTATDTNHDHDKKVLENKLERLKDLYIDGDIDKNEYANRKATFEGELSKLNELTNRNGTLANEIMELNVRQIYDKLTPENRQAFWHRFVKKIIVNKDKEVIDVIFVSN